MAGRNARADQDSRVTDLYEVVGTHFVEVMFNHLYGAAVKQFNQQNAQSLTDAYRNAISTYVVEIQSNAESYKRTVQLLHSYVSIHDNHNSMVSYSAFVDNVVKTFVPAEYFGTLKPCDCDELMGKVICSLLASMATYVTSQEILPRIIDSRDNPTMTVSLIQDQAVTTLLSERDTIHNNFIGVKTAAKSAGTAEMIEKMKKMIRRLVEEKTVLSGQLESCKHIIEGLRERGEESSLALKRLAYKLDETVIERDGLRSIASAHDRAVASEPKPEEDRGSHVYDRRTCSDDRSKSGSDSEIAAPPPPEPEHNMLTGDFGGIAGRIKNS
jgi:hypothetical protein